MDLYSQADFDGKEEALRVARSGTRSLVSDGEEKVLSFFLMPGGCDARISKDPAFEVRFSWLNNRRPSTYFARLAPGLLSQLMDLGGVSTIQDIAEFSIGPGSTGKSRYRTSFEKKWIRISCSDDEILICVRSSPTDLDTPLEYEKKRANQSPETRPTSRPVSA